MQSEILKCKSTSALCLLSNPLGSLFILIQLKIEYCSPPWNYELYTLYYCSWTDSISLSLLSWFLLSRLRLSRIIAYLEVKIWSLFQHGNLTTGWSESSLVAQILCRFCRAQAQMSLYRCVSKKTKQVTTYLYLLLRPWRMLTKHIDIN